MKAESTIRREIQRLWSRKDFYDKDHGDSPGRSWEEDQLFGAYAALNWVLHHGSSFSNCWPKYDNHKAPASESRDGK